MREITKKQELLDMIKKNQERDLFIYKYSKTCLISDVTREEMEAFDREHPEVDCVSIEIDQFSDISEFITSFAGVEHKSPQVIQYYQGEACSSLTHFHIERGILISMCHSRV